MTRDRTLRLGDGRRLGYATYGAPEGWPVIYFHGFPGSRLEAQLADAVASRMRIRLIAIDRPGFGLSDFKPGRTIFEWSEDVVKIADFENIERFAVIGVSGGGPYAAARAFTIPHRLSAAAIVSALGPLDTDNDPHRTIRNTHLIFSLARRLPWLSRALLWRVARQVRRNPETALEIMIGALPLPIADQAVLAKPEVKTTLKENIAAAFRNGSRGAACELLLYTRPWGFALRDIAMRVDLWHGEEDSLVPFAMAQYQASAIPNCRAIFCPDEGHYSLPINHMQDILSGLLS